MFRNYNFEEARQEWMRIRSQIHNEKAQNYIDGIVTILEQITKKENIYPNDATLMDLQSVVGILEYTGFHSLEG
jgi:hypothetical protein